MQSLKTGERKVVFDGGFDARYSPTGHLVYALGSTLWARPFDLSRLQAGEPVSIADGIRTQRIGRFSSGSAHFSFSSNGTLAYVPGRAQDRDPAPRSLALIDLSGKVTALKLPAGPYHAPRFSPDGKQIAVYTTDGVIWIYDLSGKNAPRQLTPEAGNILPTWTRDGYILFRSIAGGRVRACSGSVPMEALWLNCCRQPDRLPTFLILFPPDGEDADFRRRAHPGGTNHRDALAEW